MLHDIIVNLQAYLALLLAYVFIVTLAGSAKAWVAKKFGDHTAEHAGFLTLDPLIHVDFIGVMVLLLTNFGWGRDVPVNIYNIRSPRKTLKILTLFYTTTVVHILLGVITMVLFAFLKAFEPSVGVNVLTRAFEVVLQAAIGINIVLAMLRFIQSSVNLIFMHVIEEHPDYYLYIQLGSLALVMFLLLVLGNEIKMFFSTIIYILSSFILTFFA